MRGFADLPGIIEQRLAQEERLAVVLLDAFGWAFVQRHADHPLLRRLDIEPIASQFPSTTTAHLTTLSTGLPVEEHGLYEWRCYEPAAGDVIRPLPFRPARDEDPPLTIDPKVLIPGPTFFERLEQPALVLHPEEIADTPYGSAALAGARVAGFRGIERGVARLGEQPGLTYLYWDRIDAAGHQHGPSSDQFIQQSLRALDALAGFDGPLLVTADHGQLDVEAVDELDALWPELLDHLRYAPAGSARDVFLHVEGPERVLRELQTRLDGIATVHRAADLFPHAGPRLRERLADVCVLPAPGRIATFRAFPGPERDFKGHHG